METVAVMDSSYLILFKGTSASRVGTLSEAERQELMTRWNIWFESLRRAGKAVGGSRLGAQGRTLRVSAEGSVIDGPFVETKEDVVGYFHVLAASLEEAADIGRECPGLPLGITVDVRLSIDCAAMAYHPH